MTNYILKVSNGQKNTAGVKAKQDIFDILTSIEYKPIDFTVYSDNLRKLFLTKYNWKKILVNINDNDNIVLQYPMYSRFAIESFFDIVEKKKLNINKIGIIHDIESLRGIKDNAEMVQRELKLLNKFNFLIVHNDSMKKWLLDMGITTNIISLNLFDYLNNKRLRDVSADKPLIYAGNLSKSTFLEKLNISKKIVLFGVNPSDSYPNNIEYKGIKNPDELPMYLDGSYGLVWDDDGIYGEYTKYNNPHKASLYLSCGLPIIVWKQSAIAEFVLANEVGLVIDNIDGLGEKISNISEAQYKVMKSNTFKIANKVRNGEYIKEAMIKIFETRN